MRVRVGDSWSIFRQVPMALVALLLATVLSGCGSTGPAPVYEGYGLAPAGYYRVRRGDTLHKIAGRHKIGYETLARWNNLGPPYRIYAGSLLRVEPPEGKGGAKNQDALRTVTATKKTKRKKQAGAARTASVGTADNASKSSSRGSGRVAQGLHWRWPLEGKVVRRFRSGDRTRRGIRVAGHRGEKVRAAEAGTVVYSGSGLKGYGNLIIVKHNDGYLSAYGFNRRLLVREGTAVKRGQSVAEVGQASDGEYLLHFEIRRNGTAVDPLKYLP